MILHLASAAHHISTGRILNTVACTPATSIASRIWIFLPHLCVSHKKTRRRQRSQATSNNISRFTLYSRRFLRTCKMPHNFPLNNKFPCCFSPGCRVPYSGNPKRLNHFSCLFPLRRRCRQPRSNCQCRYRTRFPCFLIHVLIAPAFLQLSNQFFFYHYPDI